MEATNRIEALESQTKSLEVSLFKSEQEGIRIQTEELLPIQAELKLLMSRN